MRNFLYPVRIEPVYLIPIISIIVILINHVFFKPLAGESLILTSLNNLQEQILSTLNQMTQLLISLSTALFGFIGFFIFEKARATGKVEKKYRIDFFTSACAAALSIDCGYIFMEKLIVLLSMGIFQPYDILLNVPRIGQILFFFISLFCCGRLIYRNFFNE